MTKDKGRGVFASRVLKKGELLVVEKAVAEVVQDKQLHAITKKGPRFRVRAGCTGARNRTCEPRR